LGGADGNTKKVIKKRKRKEKRREKEKRKKRGEEKEGGGGGGVEVEFTGKSNRIENVSENPSCSAFRESSNGI